MKTKNLIRGALAILLCLMSLLAFRGVTNILNAFFVPLFLSVFIYRMRAREKIAVLLALQILCFFLLPVQVVFSFFYGLVALIITLMQQKGIRYLLIWMGVTLCAACFFYIAVRMTDWIFATKIYEITLRAMKNHSWIYFLVILLESIMVTTPQVLIIRKIMAKLYKCMDPS